MADPQELKISLKFAGQESITGDAGKVDLSNGNYLQQFTVDQTLGVPDFFSLQLQMDEANQTILRDKLVMGAEIELLVGYGVEAVIAKGEVSYIDGHFAAGELFMVASGYDGSHRLARGTNSKAWGDGHEVNQNFGTVIGSVVNDSKTGKGDTSDALSAKADATTSKTSYIAQYNSSNADFIRSYAGHFGLDWASSSHVDPKSLKLAAPEKGSSVLKIALEKPNYDSTAECQALSADFRMSTVRQVSKVVVRAWDTVDKKLIKGEATAVTPLIGGGKAGYEQAGVAHHGAGSSGRVLEIVDVPVTSVEEAKEMAAAIMGKLSMDWMTADVVVQGHPELHAGVIVNMAEFGNRFSGEYLVESVKHVCVMASGKTFTSYLKLARNSSPEK